MEQTFYRSYAKPLLDGALTVPVLILLSPVYALIALVIRLNMGAPILFRQTRSGYQGVPFTICKFRTMTIDCDEFGNLLPDARRLTRLGRFLRSSSLDELPELWNVLRGEMSLVGPRPLLVQYMTRYSPAQARRLMVKPGLTGWTQVHGRNALGWEQKFELDVWYVDHVSFGLDIKILLLTLPTVLKRAGIVSQGHSTVEEFFGN